MLKNTFFRIILVILILTFFSTIAFGLKARYVPQKPEKTSFNDGVRRDLIELKFVNGSDVRLRDGEWISLNKTDITPVTQFFAEFPSVEIRRMFDSVSEEKLTQDKINGEARTGQELADLNLWFFCHLPQDVNEQAFVDGLNSFDVVEIAYPSPIPEVAAIRDTTPDFSDTQDYLYEAPYGVSAEFAWNFLGGEGDSMKWIDIEFGWNWTHEDHPEPFFEGGVQEYSDHGVAVVGEVSGVHNEYGIKGIAPAAEVGCVSVSDMSTAQAIYMAYDNLDEGDVFLIELHAPGPNSGGDGQQGYVPMEYWQANFDAIQTATSNGVLCTEAAGNGWENLDDPVYEGKFDRNVRDSGAIMCGAATGFGLEREWFSNYGSRLDSFGWGSNVVTTGYGDLQGGEDEDYWYTAYFSGTSSASPICTGPVLCIQGVRKALGEPVMSPLELRSLMTDTGTPQLPDQLEYIGTRPDLYQALRQIVDTGNLTGTVINSETGDPVQNAVVELIYPNVAIHKDTTNMDGNFTFENHYPQEHVIRVNRYGFDTYESMITLVENDTIEMDINIMPSGMGTISGVVQNVNGDGVSATLRFYESETNFAFLLEEITTNEDGSYALDIPIGIYDMRMIADFPYPMKQEEQLIVTSQNPIELDYTLMPAHVFFVDDDDGDRYEEYYFDTFWELAEDFYWWDITEHDTLPNVNMLSEMTAPIVVWFTGDAEETALQTQEADFLVDVLEQDYSMFLTGQNIIEYIGEHELSIYLEVMHLENIEANLLFPFQDDEIGELLNTIKIVDEPGADNQTSADVLYNFGDAEPIYYYMPGGDEKVGAIHNQSGDEDGYRLVFFGFGFEAISYQEGNPNISSPEEVMQVVLDWLHQPTDVPEENLILNAPKKPALHQNFPNPFNPETVIKFDLPEKAEVMLSVYDITGKLVKTLVNEKRDAGYYTVTWDGVDERGKSVSSGIYLYRIHAGEFDAIKRCILLK